MRCPSCDHDNRDAAKFCAECAAPLVQRCGSCGAPWRPNAKFCDECGAASASASPASTPERARRAETPKHLADTRILEMRGRLAAALADAPASDRLMRQALELYRAIGATGHAERLGRELGT